MRVSGEGTHHPHPPPSPTTLTHHPHTSSSHITPHTSLLTHHSSHSLSPSHRQWEAAACQWRRGRRDVSAVRAARLDLALHDPVHRFAQGVLCTLWYQLKKLHPSSLDPNVSLITDHLTTAQVLWTLWTQLKKKQVHVERQRIGVEGVARQVGCTCMHTCMLECICTCACFCMCMLLSRARWVCQEQRGL